MNRLLPACNRLFARSIETATNIGKTVAEPLTKRTLIRVQGEQVAPFLQGLMTNDMNHLARGAQSIYTMFLNNGGRVLYDSIIYRTPDADTFLIECDKSVSNELRRHLRLYRVRRKIEIDCIESEYSPWVIFGNSSNLSLPYKNGDHDPTQVLCAPDPRVKNLGIRVILPKGSAELQKLKELFADVVIGAAPPDHSYQWHRYGLGIGEGVEDHPPSKCFPLEANCDFLHGVSFQKGCYIGQELTARVQHTGVVRKRLMPIVFTDKTPKDWTKVQSVGGTSVGTVRGVCGDRALALLRIEQVRKSPELVIDSAICKTFTPEWWPKELPSRANLKE